MDRAPFIALVSRAALEMGASLLALRVFPAVASGLLVALANNPIHVCRGLTPALAEMWPRLKKWN